MWDQTLQMLEIRNKTKNAGNIHQNSSIYQKRKAVNVPFWWFFMRTSPCSDKLNRHIPILWNCWIQCWILRSVTYRVGKLDTFSKTYLGLRWNSVRGEFTHVEGGNKVSDIWAFMVSLVDLWRCLTKWHPTCMFLHYKGVCEHQPYCILIWKK